MCHREKDRRMGDKSRQVMNGWSKSERGMAAGGGLSVMWEAPFAVSPTHPKGLPSIRSVDQLSVDREGGEIGRGPAVVWRWSHSVFSSGALSASPTPFHLSSGEPGLMHGTVLISAGPAPWSEVPWQALAELGPHTWHQPKTMCLHSRPHAHTPCALSFLESTGH